MILTTDSRIIGIDSNNKQVRLCRFEVDEISELPAPDIWTSDGVIICMGSSAHVIGDNSEHMLDSSGQWVQQVAGTSTYTREEIDALISAIDSENTSQQAEINYAVNAGAKNLLKITASSQTDKGVTFTVNDDQTVTVNGTNDGTGASTFVIVPNAQAITIPDGKYILSGCPAGGGNTVPYDLRWYLYSPGKSAYESGTGLLIEKSGNTTSSNIAIVVKTGQTANNLLFKPMLRPASITDGTFVPYAPTNRKLYEMILAL